MKSLSKAIKRDAIQKNVKIQTSEASKLERILNNTFYLDKKIEEETAFVKQVMTRGLESQERIGLHASAMIVGDNSFCVRQQVLSLLYKQRQGEQTEAGLKRIFEEGNSIHEKWQRLFIRAGFATAKNCDRTREFSEYELTFTPDIVAKIPEFWEHKIVVEIKSVNTFQFKHMTSHPSGHKQVQLYMHFMIQKAKEAGVWNGKDYMKGIVLCEDKNTQDFKVFICDYDKEMLIPIIDRCENVTYHKERVLVEGKMIGRMDGCNKPTCKVAEKCPMRDACYNVGMGRIRIGEEEDYE